MPRTKHEAALWWFCVSVAIGLVVVGALALWVSGDWQPLVMNIPVAAIVIKMAGARRRSSGGVR